MFIHNSVGVEFVDHLLNIKYQYIRQSQQQDRTWHQSSRAPLKVDMEVLVLSRLE